jgi:hypothetical protein
VESTDSETIALYFRIPVLNHGEKEDDWDRLGFVGRNELIEATFQNAMKVNPCELVSITRGNFAYILARTNIMAITLLQRLVEAEGGTVDRVALRGGSKEGFACWMASAVDDRIEVAGPGGFQMEDMHYGLQAYEDNWGCEGQGMGGVDVVALLTFLDWMNNTPAGAAALRIFSVEEFKGLLYPRFFLITGDVTLAGMHDGNYYPLGCETPFLYGFTEEPWRYDRIPNFVRDDNTWLKPLLVENLLEGPGSEGVLYPKVLTATLEVEGDRIRAVAHASQPAEFMRLWWSYSEDRVWNEKGNAPWGVVEMQPDAGGWQSPWVDIPPHMVIGWYVEAENRVTMGGYMISRYDGSPVEFIRLTDPLMCEITPPVWCTQ